MDGKRPDWVWGGDVNLFTYALGDPINWGDPSGLDRLRFNGTDVYWINELGQIIGTYPAVSGPFGKGRLPEGDYTGRDLKRRTKKGMVCDGSKTGWSLNLEPNFLTKREDLRIHPDQTPPGTEGCIGVNCGESEQLYQDLKNYFDSGFPSIPVEVNYGSSRYSEQ